MGEADRVTRAALEIAAAIEGKDVGRLERVLAPGFVYRSPGGESRDAGTFLQGIRAIPGQLLFVRLEALQVDLSQAGALLTGVQHARVRIDGKDLDDRRAFVDWFVEHHGEWRLRVAVDLPLVPESSTVES